MLLLLLAFWPQGPATREAPLLELDGGIAITRADYERHLVTAIGWARLEELALDRILEREIAGVELARVSDDVKQALADPDARALSLVAARVRAEFAGDRVAYERAVRESGITPAQALLAVRQSALREDRLAALVQARRVLDEKALARVFDDRYGVDGLRVVVRHVFVSFGRIAAEFRERRIEPPPATIERMARERCDELGKALAQGESFDDLVARGSDDPQARALAKDPAQRQLAGVVPGYNFQHFGPEFADAVRSMRPGEVKCGVKTTHGFHIVQLVSATRTRLADVQGELTRLARAEPPSLQEQRLLREELLARYHVRERLPR